MKSAARESYSFGNWKKIWQAETGFHDNRLFSMLSEQETAELFATSFYLKIVIHIVLRS